MLPMSLGLKIPSALSALPMSCITMPGSFSSATLPCHFLLRSSCQPTWFGCLVMMSALYPIESALKWAGVPTM